MLSRSRMRPVLGRHTRQYASWTTSLNMIDRHNRRVNAFVAVQQKSILEQLGKESTERFEQGKALGPLDGVPIGIKDNFCTTALPTTCASRMLSRFQSPYDATVVERLNKAGAILMGKTNLDEFAMGGSNIFSVHGPVINPHGDGESRIAGGSSGGSAAAVAAGMCPAAIGSDTGGSVRLPASYCGVVGYKPSYGRCSRHGLVAYANSLDTVGVLAKDVKTASDVYDAISGYDPKDPTSMPDPLRIRIDASDAALAAQWSADDLTGLVVGVPQEYYVHPMPDTVVGLWRQGIRYLKSLGATMVPISLPHTRLALPAYYTIALAEASSNLARYDGVRYGRRSEADSDGSLPYADTRAEGFGDEVKRRIMLGTHILTAGTYEKSFLPAQKTRRLIQADFDEAFAMPNPLYSHVTPLGRSRSRSGVHVIVTPCAISSAPELRAIEDNVRQGGGVDTYVNDVMTVPASLAGLPAISVPFGKSTEDNFPVGLQVVSQYGYDKVALRVADILSCGAE
ncbi:amidase signature domain-containing protein [Dichotomocladium elegans]|nr:amidase signature domain-containing protein [Dichotomocladium elegans]